jgi:predicted transcriptional regulator
MQGYIMATTSLKLPDALKQRINTLAEIAGKSPHAFMVEVIAEQTERVEKRLAFIQSAVAAKKNFDETGMGYEADQVHAYLRSKISGGSASPPGAKKYGKK